MSKREANKGLSFQAVPGGSLQVNTVVTVHKNGHFIQQKDAEDEEGHGERWQEMRSSLETWFPAHNMCVLCLEH